MITNMYRNCMSFYVLFILLCCSQMHGSSASSSSGLHGPLPSTEGKKQVRIINAFMDSITLFAYYCYNKEKKVLVRTEADCGIFGKECKRVVIKAEECARLNIVKEFTSSFSSLENWGTTLHPDYREVTHETTKTGYLRFIGMHPYGFSITSDQIDQHGTFILASRQDKWLVVGAD